MTPETGDQTAHDAAEHHHKPRHLAEKFEGLLGKIMVAAVVLLGVVLIYGIMHTGSSTPSWMR